MDIKLKQYGVDKVNSPIMLFLHGGGVSGWMWEPQVQHFSKHYHCIVPDLPGHGESLNAANFSIQLCAAHLNKLVSRIANGRTIVAVGFSLGAQVLLQMISSKPDLIQYAMINSALIKPMPVAAKCISPLVKLSFPLIKLRAFAKLQAATLYIGPQFFEKYYTESVTMKREVLIDVLRENMSFAIPNGYSNARCKLLITVGEQEKAIMRRSAQELHQRNGNTTLKVFEDVGHGISLKDAELFNDTLEQWLEQQRALGASSPR